MIKQDSANLERLRFAEFLVSHYALYFRIIAIFAIDYLQIIVFAGQQYKQKGIIMTQLTVSLEDVSPSVLKDVKKAISMLRGVVSVKVNRMADKPNASTVKAIEAAEAGDTIKVGTMDDYLKFVGDGMSD